MSTYRALTKHPKDNKYYWAEWRDNHFARHHYGVKFDHDEKWYNPKEQYLKQLESHQEGYFEDPNPLVKKFYNVEEEEAVKSPSHYKLPNGIECKEVSKYFSSFKGQALQYIWRAGKKDGATEEQDIMKAIECLEIELSKIREE